MIQTDGSLNKHSILGRGKVLLEGDQNYRLCVEPPEYGFS